MKKFHKLYIITIISLCVCVFQLSAQDIEGVLLGTVVDAEFIQQKFGQDYSKGVKEDLFGPNGRWLNEWVDDYPYLEVENGVVKRIEYYISD